MILLASAGKCLVLCVSVHEEFCFLNGSDQFICKKDIYYCVELYQDD